MYCARAVSGRHHAIASKNECTHDVKAGLSLRWEHMGFFCLIDAFMFHFIEKTEQLVSDIVQFFSFLNLIFHGSSEAVQQEF